MKNYTLPFIMIASVFSFGCFAQSMDQMRNSQLISDSMSNNGLAVVSYHVEERINMNFGSRITTYEVSSLSLINTNDLGQNNTRKVTPKYAKAKAVAVHIEQPKSPVDNLTIAVNPVKIEVPKESEKYVNIDILSTYERVLDKGYKSADMLKRVADNRFFAGDLAIAAKWYAQLFELNTDLDAVYYYRYAQSLKSVSQMDKANQMMAIFENKNH